VSDHVLTLACRDRVGIVHAVTGFLAENDCNILDSQQFGDPDSGTFFMRVHFQPLGAVGIVNLETAFGATVATRFGMQWQLADSRLKCPTLILVSRLGHCLNDLLFRWQSGALHIDVRGIVSNHQDLAGLAAHYGVPFHHLPVRPDNRAQQEAAIASLIADNGIDLVVLARYMQILSKDLCESMGGRIINIHHSFLPSFKGARPYQQAHDHGVKLIGATAHYVTADLDEGPIIEQEVARVDHTHSPDRLTAVGRDVESVTLARAVQAHAEHRVLLNGARTVVFK